MPELRTETMTVNMGPQHPSTHGVLRLVLELDGETVVSAAPTIGYLHTGIEKTTEQKKFQQVIPLVERMDYLSAQSNAYAYCLSVEKLLGLEVPDRVKWIRVLLAELQRINSHLVWLGTHAMEVGAVSVMLYCFRERELLLDINERIAGFRHVSELHPHRRPSRRSAARAFTRSSRNFWKAFPRKIGEYEGLLTKNDIYRQRTRGVGKLSKQDCIDLSLTRPIGRASGWDYDVRKMFPYGGYDTFDFRVPVCQAGDVYDRYLLRIAEMRESVGICRQASVAHHAVGRVCGRCADGRAPAEGSRLYRNGSADSALPDLFAGLHGARRRGVCARRRAARRAGILRGVRRHQSALAREGAVTVASRVSGVAKDDHRRPHCRRHRRHRLDRCRHGRRDR